jgi:putative ABC transport system permease protein
MKFSENMHSAWSSLVANKLRSILTMLGIIIGIAAVIGIMTVGDGLSDSVVGKMSTLGVNNVTLFVQQRNNTEAQQGDIQQMMTGTTMNGDDLITQDMIDALGSKYKSQIDSTGISESAGSGKAEKKGEYANVSVLGVNEHYMDIESVKMKAGRGITGKDDSAGKNVAVVSSRLVKNLFDGNNDKALGSRLSVIRNNKKHTFRIVGVYKYEASSAMQMPTSQSGGAASEKDINTNLYIPVSVSKDISGADDGYSMFTVKTKTSVDSQKFADRAAKFLSGKYYKDNDQFHVSAISMDSMLDAMEDMIGKISLGLAVIAGISLLVGGIGVMNIMLVSVTERTREIGIRKALGATNRDIRRQFVTESVIVCLIGGAIGIILGSILGYAGSDLIGFKAVPSAKSILISFGFAFAIGVFFGFYPARKASRLDPIDALRYE